MNPLMNSVGSNAEGKLNCINAVVITQKKALALASAFFIKPAYAHDVWRALYSPNPKKIYPEVSL